MFARVRYPNRLSRSVVPKPQSARIFVTVSVSASITAVKPNAPSVTGTDSFRISAAFLRLKLPRGKRCLFIRIRSAAAEQTAPAETPAIAPIAPFSIPPLIISAHIAIPSTAFIKLSVS